MILVVLYFWIFLIAHDYVCVLAGVIWYLIEMALMELVEAMAIRRK